MKSARAGTERTFCAGVATDPGLERPNNEDRLYADQETGIYVVVDGLGGHAAGEMAAQTAIETFPREFQTARGALDRRLRAAITAANNEIYRLSQSRAEWSGMACVLTAAALEHDRLTVGHVGDSRLYLAWPGGLRKLTADHSPVGEREDAGDLTEEQAMRDPRRNQIFRDVGSRPREANDPGFIDVKSIPLRADAAFLLCTDGLSDALTHAEMNAIVQSYRGDPGELAHELVRAANAAGGRDNISVIFVAGPEFIGQDPLQLQEVRARHSVTRMRRGRSWRSPLLNVFYLLLGAALGIGGLISYERSHVVTLGDSAATLAARPSKNHRDPIRPNPNDPGSLARAIAAAQSGDIIELAPGEYAGPIELKDGITLTARDPGLATIYSLSQAPVLTLRDVRQARIDGIRFDAGRNKSPIALLITNSNTEIIDTEVTGATECGVRIEGKSQPFLVANRIYRNGNCGISTAAESAPRLVGNTVDVEGGKR